MERQEITMTNIPHRTGDLLFAADEINNDGGKGVGCLPEELSQVRALAA
ncbi:hypothetical protein [Candidatus Accumulibacter sp. ACC003]|nr:hypothetical protein [Candidatus Accumulibacter sp. ACC003]